VRHRALACTYVPREQYIPGNSQSPDIFRDDETSPGRPIDARVPRARTRDGRDAR